MTGNDLRSKQTPRSDSGLEQVCFVCLRCPSCQPEYPALTERTLYQGSDGDVRRPTVTGTSLSWDFRHN